MDNNNNNNYEIKNLPRENILNKMSSNELEVIGEKYSKLKNQFLQDIRIKQNVIQQKLSQALIKEQKKRIEEDPHYFEKHQGIGSRIP